MREQAWLPTCHTPQPLLRPPPMPPQALIFRHRPPRQLPVKVLEGRGQGRRVRAGGIVEPAWDDRIEPPRQLINPRVHPTPQLPPSHCWADRLRRGVAHARAEVDEVLPPPMLRPPGPTRVAQEVNVLFEVGPPSVFVLAGEELRLLGMPFQSTVGPAARKGSPSLLGLGLTRAMADRISGKTLEKDMRSVPLHPHIAGGMQQAICQQR